MALAPVTVRSWRLPESEDLRISVLSGRGELRYVRLAALALVVIAVGLGGSLTDSAAQYGLTLGVIYAIAILGGDLVIATLGEVNLATGASMAVGAYSFAWSAAHGINVTGAIAFAAGMSGVIGAVVAIPTIRLTGVFTALVTFALAFAVPDLIVQLQPVTGGQAGTAVTLSGKLAGFDLTNPASLLLLCTLVFFVLAAGILLLLHGRAGRTAIAVGESRRAAESFGIRGKGWAIGIWTASAVLCGISGALLAALIGFISPAVFPVLLSITLLVGSFAGGPRSPLGALLGGLLVGTVPPQIQSVVPASATSLALGLVLLVVLMTGQRGLGGLLERLGLRLVALGRRPR